MIKSIGMESGLKIPAAEQSKEWIETACNELGLKPSQLAKNSGVSPSTITRLLNKTTTFNTSSTTLNKIIGYIEPLIREKIADGSISTKALKILVDTGSPGSFYVIPELSSGYKGKVNELVSDWGVPQGVFDSGSIVIYRVDTSNDTFLIQGSFAFVDTDRKIPSPDGVFMYEKGGCAIPGEISLKPGSNKVALVRMKGDLVETPLRSLNIIGRVVAYFIKT